MAVAFAVVVMRVRTGLSVAFSTPRVLADGKLLPRIKTGRLQGRAVCLVAVAFAVVVMAVRTGLSVAFSTPRLAGMATARLQVPHLDPRIARRQAELTAQRHRLPPVGEEATYRGVHRVSVAFECVLVLDY